MSAEATLNVRFNGASKEVKKRGDLLLAKNGISTSEAVRRLYAFLDETQEIPDWMKAGEKDVFELRREALRSLAGIAPLKKGETLEDLRKERLSKYSF